MYDSSVHFQTVGGSYPGRHTRKACRDNVCKLFSHGLEKKTSVSKCVTVERDKCARTLTTEATWLKGRHGVGREPGHPSHTAVVTTTRNSSSENVLGLDH